MRLVLANDIEALDCAQMRDLMQSDDPVSAIQCGCRYTDPVYVIEMGIDMTIDLQRQGSHAGCAKANKESAVDQQVDNIAQDLIDQGICN